MLLQDLVINTASKLPDALAIKVGSETISYGELDKLANRIARALSQLGVQKGDRVGLWIDKSIASIASMQAALRLGAAYVPMDPLSPAIRARLLVSDCQMKAVVTSSSRAKELFTEELATTPYLSTDNEGNYIKWGELDSFSSEPLNPVDAKETELAYILYTSGSTGKPKGVCISHLNALAFVRWAAEELKAKPGDILSNHAPFHFDLSVMDLYVAFLSGAMVSLVPETISYMPKRLVEFMKNENITIWYSVPSALMLMMEQGGLFELQDIPLHTIVFAGEPFPIKQLQRLRQTWPDKRLINMYGPTETNVCTFFEVKDIDPEATSIPIGVGCSGDSVWAVKDDSTIAGVGEEGELMVSGPTVMLGYWGLPPHGDKPYPTGDIVRLQADGNYFYIARRDFMVKVRGHRIELGDVEATLLKHDKIREAAVIVSGTGLAAKLVAFLVAESTPPSLLEIKRHCAERLPRYMIVDEIRFIEALPRTRNGKVNRMALSSGNI
jgi:amino acid adenylation domain-containing protein